MLVFVKVASEFREALAQAPNRLTKQTILTAFPHVACSAHLNTVSLSTTYEFNQPVPIFLQAECLKFGRDR
jgi:hypothetical protein